MMMTRKTASLLLSILLMAAVLFPAAVRAADGDLTSISLDARKRKLN
ncbi:hypothetical protein [Paenibacillus lemnae]|nr:hypothetical protein [Paenibacillus lemnae]